MDQKLFQMINNLAGKNNKVDNLMIFASKKTRYIFGFLLFFICLFNRSYKNVFYQLSITILLNSCINLSVNQIAYRPRPFLTRKAIVLLPSKIDSTLISKHTILGFAVSTTIFMYKKWIGVTMYLMAGLTGLSRIWTGAHYPSDVIRSAFIGSIVSLVVNWISRFVSLIK